ncbi:MAG: insulinase family protein [Dorea sp.]|nr:insulinase family protein [Dorea sp.]
MSVKDLAQYEIIKERDLQDVKCRGILLKHKKSGARLVLMEAADDNKVFSIGFRTPPEDSTGLPHILEHSVLCGSENFPVKDPFVELVKGSMNTFLNAMTYPDKTVYPVASCNDKDFRNLMHVYLDAVFYPNIYQHDEIFRQEGWSYKLESENGDLEYNGVVYNEMKGAFSSPEGVLDRVTLNTLFPDTSYAYESGGDPEEIPNLSYEQFLAFHKKYYHPSNSYIYLYGDMDMEERLIWLDREYLSKFDKIEIDSEIRYQEPFARMKEVKLPYSITSEEPLEDNTYLSYNKVIGTSLDKELYVAFEILDYALLSAPGAPLKKALLEAGIGKDIMGSYDNGIYQPIFSVVAKNANADQKEAFVKLIEERLSEMADKGIDKKALKAGINYHEFQYREADYGRYPKGLMYGLQILDSWLYDEKEPFMHIQALGTFEFLKEQMNTSYFEDLVRKFLLDNQHGAVIVVEPEQGRTARMDRELYEKLQDYKKGLSKEEIKALARKTKELEDYQSEPSDEEALATIPVLRREDISREPQPVYNEEMKIEDIPVVFHEIDTNGIGYVTLLFDMSKVPEELLPYVGILQGVLGIIDTENYEYGELFNEINLHTGGIGTSMELYPDVTKVREKEFKATFEIKSKSLYRKLPVAFAMMKEILTRSKLGDEKRLKEILAMTTSRLLMRFQSNGHVTAALRAQSYASPSAKLKDMTNGIEYYQKVSAIEKNFEKEKGTLISNLEKLAKALFKADNMMISYTAEREGLPALEAEVKGFADGLFTEEVKLGDTERCIIHCEKKNEGFKTASKVQYVARCGNFIDAGTSYTGVLQVLKVIMGYEYLWQNIRVKGGAYGCMSSFNRIGEGFFVSYRDPNLKRTIEVYEGVADYLREFTVSDFDMNKYVIGTMSNLDQPMTPSLKGDRSLNLYMNHVSEDMLREERRQVLEAEQEDIRRLAPIVEAMMKAEQLCVIGSEEKITEAGELFDTVTVF